MRAIGLMSGTSLDGVDAALIETDGHRVQGFGPSLTLPYDAALRRDLRDLLDRAPSLDPCDEFLRDVEARVTRRHVEAVRALSVPADLLGFHGQTILHRPQARRTWQIGNAALLARETGLPVAWDFRSADVAAGGQGAPLVPIFHVALAASLAKPLIILNIGGVANLTWIDEASFGACDTGPGNALLDDWVFAHTGARMDLDGALAASGTPDEARLRVLLSHEFFQLPPPKSLDRQDFVAAFAHLVGLSAADGAATLACFTARAVAATKLPIRPKQVLVTGGGRRNPAIMAALATSFDAPVAPVESIGWDGDTLEAQCFGYLAVRVESGLPLSFPSTTGAKLPLPGGRITRP